MQISAAAPPDHLVTFKQSPADPASLTLTGRSKMCKSTGLAAQKSNLRSNAYAAELEAIRLDDQIDKSTLYHKQNRFGTMVSQTTPGLPASGASPASRKSQLSSLRLNSHLYKGRGLHDNAFNSKVPASQPVSPVDMAMRRGAQTVVDNKVSIGMIVPASKIEAALAAKQSFGRINETTDSMTAGALATEIRSQRLEFMTSTMPD